MGGAGRRSSLADLRNPSDNRARSIQFNFDLVNTGRAMRGLIIATDTTGLSWKLIAPSTFDTIGYGTRSEDIRKVAITEGEAWAAIESLQTVPAIRNSGVHRFPALALSVARTGRDTAVYHCVLNAELASVVIPKLQRAWSRNTAATSALKSVAFTPPPPPPVDLSPQVDVRLGKFKIERLSGMPVSRIEVRNRGPAIRGRVLLVLQPAENVQVVSSAGTTRACAPKGSPYIVIQDSGIIEQGTARAITVRILNPDNVPTPIHVARAWLANGEPY